MPIVALVLVGVSAVLHIVIFAMESLFWRQPRVWKRFGLASQEDAETTAPMAYNQGFYNLFLAIVGILGIVLDLFGNPAGFALMLVAIGAMIAASIVLTTTGKGYLKLGLTQGRIPVLALVALLVWH